MRPIFLPGQAASWLVASSVVAALNLIEVARRVNPELRVVTKLGIVVYDWAFFLLLGLGGAVTSISAAILRRRLGLSDRSLVSVLLSVAVGAGLGAALLPIDLYSFVARHRLPISAMLLATSLGATTLLSLALLRMGARGWLMRGFTVSLGVGLGLTNGWYLIADYRGVHFLVALAATSLLATGLMVPLASTPLKRWEPPLLVFALLVTVFATTIPPRDAVRQGLWLSSGSAVFPLVAPHVRQRTRIDSRRLPLEKSPFFRDRTRTPKLPPSTVRLLPEKKSAVLLLTVEAMRAEILERADLQQRLPTFARLRERGAWFRMARTPSPATVVTFTSLFTGKYYSQIEFRTFAPGVVNPSRDRSSRLPGLLERARIDTVLIAGYHGILARDGVGRGFGEERRFKRDFPPASEVGRRVVEELEEYVKGERSRFVVAHFLDSHYPYTSAGKKDTPYEGYLAELGLIDRQLKRLFSVLEERKLEDEVLVIVAGDHGEAFGEHGTLYHGRTVYDEVLRVPLLVVGPGVVKREIETPVTLLDLPPTVLDLFGVATPGSFMGQTLVPTLVDQPFRFERPIAADAGRRKQALVFPDGLKVILDVASGTVEVYDLRADPGELYNLTDDPNRDLDGHIGATERFFRTHQLKLKDWEPPWRRS